MSLSASELPVGHDRIKQLFEFLRALNNQRNPVKRQQRDQLWFRRLDLLPDHPSISLTRLVHEVLGSAGADRPDVLLRVARPTLTNAPDPPDLLRPWLLAGWDDWRKEQVRFREARNGLNDAGETVTLRFVEDLECVEASERWREQRQEWRVNEVPARSAMQEFEALHTLYGDLQRRGEQTELMVGSGVLGWRQPAGAIEYPLLAQRVELAFDASVPEFTLVDADTPTELNMALLQELEGVASHVLIGLRDLVSQNFCHPFAEEASGVLSQIPTMLASGGKYLGHEHPSEAPDAPEIGHVPVLFLRNRAQGLSAAIDQVLVSLHRRDRFPRALLNVVGVPEAESGDYLEGEGTGDPQTSSAQDTSPGAIGGRHAVKPAMLDALFAKESNPEQTRIAQRLNQHDCVLVQGPPGTGKSHTIANLIGHLLAQGKSVLVTSHKTKALQVLSTQLPRELQPLCISVLDNDAENKDQLKFAVRGISERLDSDDPETLTEEAKRLRDRREALKRKLSASEADMWKARQSEYREVCFGGERMLPIDAAKWVGARAATDAWLPGPVSLGATLPLTPAEVVELYWSNGETGPEDEQFLGATLPPSDELPAPESVRAWVEQLEALECKSLREPPKLAKSLRITVDDLDRLSQVIEGLDGAIHCFDEFQDWELSAVDAGRKGANDRAPWEHLLGKIKELDEAVSAVQLSNATHQPQVPCGEPLSDQLRVVSEIITHIHETGGLSKFRLMAPGQWRRMVGKWKVRGVPPQLMGHFAAIQKALELRLAENELTMLWDGLMARAGACRAEELMEDLSGNTSQFADAIALAIRWWDLRWRVHEAALTAWGLNWSVVIASVPPVQEKFGVMKRTVSAVRHHLLDVLRGKHDQLRIDYLEEKLETTARQLKASSHPDLQGLAVKLSDRDADGYLVQFQLVKAASVRQKIAQRRQELIVKLERHDAAGQPLAGGWAKKIRTREGIHGTEQVPGDVVSAWKWRQLNDELDNRASLDLQEIGDQINQYTADLRKVTINLIDRLAWASQVRRTRPQQRRALTGWMDTLDAIKQGYGIRVPELRRAARSQMKDCQSAVPVWIMPLTRLTDNFDLSTTTFDVVIIDEASQCDVLSLIAFAVAKQVVVVGDHEQVSPSAFAQEQTSVQSLIQTHLDGIPSSHQYDGRLSVFDLARQSFGGQIRLVEHFRCVPDIIEFSNQLSYQGEIKPLREAASSPFRQAVVEYRNEASSASNKVNVSEAQRVAALMVAALEQPEYQDQSMGVICMVGDQQALAIERLLRLHLSPQVIEGHRILCGRPPEFQGDERDVMFLSLVDVSNGKPLRLRATPDFKQRFNVAASRAKNQMWVVHSMDTADLHPGDLRLQLIEHARAPKRRNNHIARVANETESRFERNVLERLMLAGFEVHPQWQVGRYRIDLVVQGGGIRLAIECDGDRYHGSEELPNDMARQAVLERLGWTFFRIRGSEFFRDPNTVMTRLFSKIREMGIEPSGNQPPTDNADGQHDELTRRVSARADQLIAEWNPRPVEEAEAEDSVASESDPSNLAPLSIEPEEDLVGEAEIMQVREQDLAYSAVLNMANEGVVVNAGTPTMIAEDGVSEEEQDNEEDSIPSLNVPEYATAVDCEEAFTEDLGADAWFGLARWARENDALDTSDQEFADHQGLRVSKGNSPSEQEWPICLRVMRQARDLGFFVVPASVANSK